MHRIGLTGGIGSGKSTVLAMLVDLGAAAVDADAISRSVTAPGGPAVPLIAARFGPDFIGPNGALDRDRMRDHIYAQPEARRALEGIVHPLVSAAIRLEEDRARDAGSPCLIYDIPLLVESGRWRAALEKVVVVDCEPDTQIQRVVARSGLAPEQVRAIIAAQAPRARRLAAADLVICNQALSLAQLAQEVRQASQSFGL